MKTINYLDSQSPCTSMHKLFVGLLLIICSLPAQATPLTWYLTATMSNGTTLGGSFVYDADIGNPIVSTNITSSAPGGPFNVIQYNGGAIVYINSSSAPAIGNPALQMYMTGLTNAGGSNIAVGNPNSSFVLGTCVNAACDTFNFSIGSVSGTLSATPPGSNSVAVPTLNKWGMIMMASLMTLGAFVFMRRKQN